MDSTIKAAFIGGAFVLLAALIQFWMKRNEAKVARSSGHFTDTFFKWMELPQPARKKLEESELIKIGETEQALARIVGSAKPNDSILAICGYKGSYAKNYYRENFRKCKVVKRIFSYDAMHNEIIEKGDCFALDGLRMHLDEKETGECKVEVFVLSKGKRIKDLTSGEFDPPLSFGLTILCGSSDDPKKAVIHWETAAEPLRHLIGIEGFVINGKQKGALKRLVKLHKSIARADGVLSSAERDGDGIAAICVELDEFFESSRSQLAARERSKG